MLTKFDWHREPLTTKTRIDSGYKTTQNVRRFFKLHVDPDFHFNREFMNWMKTNIGKSLGEAISEYKRENNSA